MSKKYNQKLISGSLLGALVAIIAMLLVFAILLSVFIIVAKPFSDGADGGNGGNGSKDDGGTYPFRQDINITIPEYADNCITINEKDIDSERALVLDMTDNVIIASRKSDGAKNIMYPASMTKVMTLIVVYENLKSESSLNEVLTISEEVQARMEEEGSSGYGLKAGDTLTVSDLMYVMILKSDNIACVTLAEYISNSEANFVKLMNDKAREMGFSEKTTLFQNCTGLHHDYHYTTCKDMAVIMSYAMQNTFCAEILSSLSHTPSKTFRNGEGSIFYNAFLVHDINIQNPPYALLQPNTAEITAGKTGFTEPETSGQCLVSYAKGDDGKEYIIVTSKASKKYAYDENKVAYGSIPDHLYLYNTYAK